MRLRIRSTTWENAAQLCSMQTSTDDVALPKACTMIRCMLYDVVRAVLRHTTYLSLLRRLQSPPKLPSYCCMSSSTSMSSGAVGFGNRYPSVIIASPYCSTDAIACGMLLPKDTQLRDHAPWGLQQPKSACTCSQCALTVRISAICTDYSVLDDVCSSVLCAKNGYKARS